MTVKGFAIIIILIALACGIGEAWGIVKAFVVGIWDFIKALPPLLAATAPFIGIKDWLASKVICFLILALLSWVGVIVSQRAQRKLWAIVSGIVGIISTLAMLAGL